MPHSPAPWSADIKTNGCNVWAGDGMRICEVRGWGYSVGVGGLNLPPEKAAAIQDANTRLISAAPELLEACKAVKAFLDNLEANTDADDPLSELRKRIHAPMRAKLEPAIRKAET